MTADLRKLLDDLDAGWERWDTDSAGLDVATTNGEVWNTLFRRPTWLSGAEVHELVHLHNSVPRLTAAVRAVLELHKPFTDSYGIERPWCQHDPDDSWPCPTIAALTAALNPAPPDEAS